MPTKRQTMRESNKTATEYLLKLGAEHIWIKPHYRFNTDCVCSDYTYKMQDIFNLFDGLCSYKNNLWGIQIKTRKMDDKAKYQEFQYDWAKNLPVFIIKVDEDKVEHIELVPKGFNIRSK